MPQYGHFAYFSISRSSGLASAAFFGMNWFGVPSVAASLGTRTTSNDGQTGQGGNLEKIAAIHGVLPVWKLSCRHISPG
jgi:hypothetical protein